MPINAQGYFDHLRSYLNMQFYGVVPISTELDLKEKIFIPGGKTTISVKLLDAQNAFAVKLDKSNTKGNHEPLFHFLDDNAKPWARRCDFIVFHLHRQQINAHCIEFKWETLSVDSIKSQLDSSVSWCRTMWTAIKVYTGHARRINARKYVLSRHPDAAPYLDASGKYLRADQSVRHYLYSDINGLEISQLDNTCVDSIG